MQGLGSYDQRRAHGVEGKFLKVVAGFLGEDLVDHESLVAPPGCFKLAGRAQSQLRVAVHGEPGPRGLARWRGLCPAPRQRGRRRSPGGARRGAGTRRAGRASTPTRGSASSPRLFGAAQLSISARFPRDRVRSPAEGRRLPARPARLCHSGSGLRAACPPLWSPPACQRLALLCLPLF